jgi:hypothetical protein
VYPELKGILKVRLIAIVWPTHSDRSGSANRADYAATRLCPSGRVGDRNVTYDLENPAPHKSLQTVLSSISSIRIPDIGNRGDASMKASDVYRHKALELCQKANTQSDFDLRVEYEALAFAYMCLADQTERDWVEWDQPGAIFEQTTKACPARH